jgi:hypothetical protein
VGRLAAFVTLALATAVLAAGCGSPASTGGAEAPEAVRQSSPSPGSRTPEAPVATISDRDGPSWSGRLGDTVQIDFYDQTTGETLSERIAVLAVKRLPNPGGDDVPNEFGDDYGAYEWKYGIRVRLTGLSAATARMPIAYQFLSLSDGSYSEDGVAGLGTPRGPDPSRVGKSSVGWLYQWVDQDFTPTAVLMPIGAWKATWSLE